MLWQQDLLCKCLKTRVLLCCGFVVVTDTEMEVR
jgi:hypothetical protein